jgi:hypothetical protein
VSTIDRVELLLPGGENLTVPAKLINRAIVEAGSRLCKRAAVKPEHRDPFGMPLDRVLNVIVEQSRYCEVHIRSGGYLA